MEFSFTWPDAEVKEFFGFTAEQMTEMLAWYATAPPEVQARLRQAAETIVSEWLWAQQ
jgi:hypothetical protein